MSSPSKETNHHNHLSWEVLGTGKEVGRKYVLGWVSEAGEGKVGMIQECGYW